MPITSPRPSVRVESGHTDATTVPADGTYNCTNDAFPCEMSTGCVGGEMPSESSVG